MAIIYSYTFGTQLSTQSGGQTFAASGTFTVNYDSRSVYNLNVTAGGRQFTNGLIANTVNSDGATGYNVQLYNSQFSNDSTYLNFYYQSPTSANFSSVQYLRSFTDNSTFPSTTTYTQAGANSVAANPVAVCFVNGTRIRTDRGEVAVEELRVGDAAVTASGALRPVIWIGHRTLDGAGKSLPHGQQPVRIRAGAFGGGLPTRDLSLSPGHPVLVGADANGAGGHLVPVMCLINGTTIAREPASAVTYWHVELDAHDILLAEGLAAESYLDWGDRPFFTEASDHALHNPDFVVPELSARCRPVAVEGTVVEAERARLSAVFAHGLGAACAWDEAGRFAWIAA